MSETAIVAIVSALFGFVGGLIPSISQALKARADHALAVKQSDLDHLRAIIDEQRAELDRLKLDRQVAWDELEQERQEQEARLTGQEARIQALEQDCDEKNKLIGKLETQIANLIQERQELESRISDMAEYIETLITVMRSHNIPVPERKRINSKVQP